MKAYLGIDISKGYADFILLNAQGKAFEDDFRLDDTRQGHDILKKYLSESISLHGIEQLYCAVESTGGFENNWYSSLVQMSSSMPLKVTRLNPATVRHHSRATLSRNVTDALSARYIAEYILSQGERIDYTQQNKYYNSFRGLHGHINLMKKQKTQLINELKAILYNTFPEMTRYCKSGVPVWVLALLQKYPSSQAVAKLKPAQLCRIRYITPAKAHDLLEKAKASVAAASDIHACFLVKSLAMEIEAKAERITQLKDYMAEQCQGKELELLKTIPGIGAYSAAAIMIEIEDIRRFASPKSLACYFGLHPELKESGDKKLTYRMSKKGRASMRATLFMSAFAAVRADEHCKSIYHRHRQKGKSHYQAIGVIMHKLVRIIWGMLSSATAYDSKTDQANQERKADTTQRKQNEMNKKRRYQPMDESAPVSKRQAKARKALLESQVSNNGEQVRDLPSVPNQS